jgi:MFS family permease
MLPIVWGGALVGLAVSALVPSPVAVAIGGAIVGAASGFGLTQLSVLSGDRVESNAEARAGGLILMSRYVGGTIGMPIFGAWLYFSNNEPADHVATTAARGAYLLMAVVAVVGLIGALSRRKGLHPES